MGRRKNYNPKNKGKRSYQPILTFLAETREYLMGGYAVDDRPSGKEIVAHPESAFRALPAGVKKIFARADAGFCCRGAGRWKPTNKRVVSSSSQRARRGDWSNSCSKQNGGPRLTATLKRNAKSLYQTARLRQRYARLHHSPGQLASSITARGLL